MSEKPKSWQRWLWRVLLGLLALPLLMVLAFMVRVVWFPTHYDVPSIAHESSYQNPTLMTRAWALPAARGYASHVDFQSNGSVCGPASLANVFRSLHEPAVSEPAVLEGSGLCRTGFCVMGLTLDQVADLARARTGRTVTVLRGLSLASFREHLNRSNDPARRYVINFHRGLLFGEGNGHFSPLAGYLADEDLAFVLDVNAKFKPWLVKSERLFKAMDSTDPSTGKKRGLLLVE